MADEKRKLPKEETEKTETMGPENIMAAVESGDPAQLLAALKEAFNFISGADETNAIREITDNNMVDTFFAELEADGEARVKFGFAGGFLSLGIVKFEGQPASVGLVDKTVKQEYKAKWSGTMFG